MDKATKRTVAFTAFVLAIGLASALAPAPVTKLVTPAAEPVTRLTQTEETKLATFARDQGYICNRVMGSRRLISEPGVSLYCESWVYDFHQKAGRWTITPRKGWGQ